RAAVHRGVEELQREHADHQERYEIVRPAAAGHDEAEDRAVDKCLETGAQEHPRHAQPVALVLALDPVAGQGQSEVTALPDLLEAGGEGRSGNDTGEAEAFGLLRQFGTLAHRVEALSSGTRTRRF